MAGNLLPDTRAVRAQSLQRARNRGARAVQLGASGRGGRMIEHRSSGMAVPRRTELEAESTAHVTCQALGLDTSDCSFGYVANWAGGGGEAIAAIRASGERIQKTAARILRLF